MLVRSKEEMIIYTGSPYAEGEQAYDVQMDEFAILKDNVAYISQFESENIFSSHGKINYLCATSINHSIVAHVLTAKGTQALGVFLLEDIQKGLNKILSSITPNFKLACQVTFYGGTSDSVKMLMEGKTFQVPSHCQLNSTIHFPNEVSLDEEDFEDSNYLSLFTHKDHLTIHQYVDGELKQHHINYNLIKEKPTETTKESSDDQSAAQPKKLRTSSSPLWQRKAVEKDQSKPSLPSPKI